MKRMILLCLALCMVLSGCAALPGEERAFAVCLGLHTSGDIWQASARISTYTKPGEYMTVTASGKSMAEAMTLLDATAPLHIHYGQVRLVLLSKELAASDELLPTLDRLNKLGEFRADAMLCVTEDDIPKVLDEMKPVTGTRLSKYIEVLLDSRIGQGSIPDTTLGAYRRMGERQSLTLIPIAMAEKAAAQTGMNAMPESMAVEGMKLQMGGAWLASQAGRVTGRLTVAEQQILRLMQGKLRKGALTLDDHTFTLLESFANVTYDEKEHAALLKIRLRYMHSDLSEDGVKERLTSAAANVIEKLAAANCDALGIGRQAMMHASDWAAWERMDWQTRYPALVWRVAVEAVSAQ